MISVIIPLFNKESAISNTIKSVLLQTYKNFELLIVNDGSTDKSMEIVNSIKDNRIKVLSKPNGGVSDARNFGIVHSKGDYIFFLDADDVINPNCFTLLVDLSNKYSKAEVLTSNFEMISANNKIKFCKRLFEGYVDNPFQEFWKRNIFLRTGNVLLKRICFEEGGILFDARISLYEDLDFMVRLISKYKIAYTPEVSFVYDTTYSYLSLYNGPLEKEFAFYIKLENSISYKNLLLSENVFYSYLSKLRQRRFDSFFKLLFKNLYRNHIVIYSILYRKIIKK